MVCYTVRMNTPNPVNHNSNCERWAADSALMLWLENTAQVMLKIVGDTTDINQMLRAQGMYKGVEQLISQIKGGATKAELDRNQLRQVARVSIPPSF